MTVYYNEIEPYCVQWLRNLMDNELIPRGDIDTRSIEDVVPNELKGYTQAHFFAGLGGWPYAIQLAGWGTRPVWTGSCPCQPFSAAGKRAGFADERHLWPAWQHLIAQCRPAVVFGEQVTSKDAEPWIDLVHADMEGMDYAFGCVPFPAAGIGAPHIRDRYYWVADAERHGSGRKASRADNQRAQADGPADQRGGCGGPSVRLADADNTGQQSLLRPRAEHPAKDIRSSEIGEPFGHLAGRPSQHGAFRMFDSEQPGPTNGLWGTADWLSCRDGLWRPVEPGTFPLAHGIPNRVGRLRAYGNAINAEVAAAFIRAYCEAKGLIFPESSESPQAVRSL